MEQVSIHSCTYHGVYAKSNFGESDMGQTYCDHESETEGDWLIISQYTVDITKYTFDTLHFIFTGGLFGCQSSCYNFKCNYNFLSHYNTIDMHSTITIRSMSRLMYNANFIQLIARDTTTTNSITKNMAKQYTFILILLYFHNIHDIYQMVPQLLLSVFCFVGLFQKMRSGRDFRHILASCHMTSPPKMPKIANKNPQTGHASINGQTKASFTKHIKTTLSH